MFAAPPNYMATQPVSSFSPSIPQIPAVLNFAAGSIPSGGSDATAFSPPFLSQASLNGFLSQSQDTVLSAPDMNSPDVFRQNIHYALGEVEKLQLLARTVLTSIQSAYHPGIAPHHTQANITRLQEQLMLAIQVFRQSGIGALPMLSMGSTTSSIMPDVLSDTLLLETTAKNLQALYDQLQRRQDSAGIVVNLLGVEKEKERSALNA